MSQMTSLARFYAGWDSHQERLITAIAPLTPDQLRLTAAPHLLPVGVLAAHIVGVRAFWFHQVMREGPPEIAAWMGLDDEDESARPVERLVRGLAETWAMIEAVLARCTPENLDETFQRIDPGRVRTYTRQWIIWHVLEHDIHHAGEISLTLGAHGLPGLES